MLCFVGMDGLPDASSQCATGEGTYDEHPNLAQCVATGEEGGTNAACGVHAGAGEVDADEVDEDEAQADGQSGEVIGSAVGLRRSAEHHEDEEAGEHHLDDEAVEHTEGAGVGARERSGIVSFLQVGKRLSIQLLHHVGCDQASRLRDDKQHGSCQDGSDDLEHHVHAAVLRRHASGEEASQGDGGVDVASADAADGVSHGYDGQTKGHGCAHNAGSVAATAQGYGCAATQERQYECTNQFS